VEAPRQGMKALEQREGRVQARVLGCQGEGATGVMTLSRRAGDRCGRSGHL
jgi:hypothetical protein